MKRYAFAFLALTTIVGCSTDGLSPELTQQRDRYLLATEPDDALAVEEAQSGAKEGDQVVMVGMIGGVDQPLTAGKAQFVLADPSLAVDDAEAAHSHGAAHDHDNCPFCKQQAADKLLKLALVEFRGADGQVLPVDASQLFSVSAGQTVVVRGKSHRDELGNLVVAADGIYVRR